MKNLKKKLFGVMVSALLCMSMALSAFAEGTGTANSQVVSGLTSVANDMTATAASLIPIALGVVGISLVVVYGIKLFNRITRK